MAFRLIGGVLFPTLNAPGGDHNFARDRAEFTARDAAVREWLRQARVKRAGSRLILTTVPGSVCSPLTAHGS